VCNTGAGSDKLTFISKAGLSSFLLDDSAVDNTVRTRRGDTATVMSSTARPVVLHYGKDSTHVKFNFTYVRHNAYGTATTSY